MLAVLLGALLLAFTTQSTLSFHQPCKGAYIHIPFCRKRCHYCSFAMQAIGDDPLKHSKVTLEYAKTLLSEISTTLDSLPHLHSPLDTLYFGGGTPSLMDVRGFEDIIATLDKRLGFGENPEITVEMDPGTFNEEKMRALKALGVNRVSLGVQSFDDFLLEKCGRVHRVEDVWKSFDILERCGVENINIDIISSLPFSTNETWTHTLRTALQTPCKHMSVYDLQVEKLTLFDRMYKVGESPLPSEVDSAFMYETASRVLREGGLEHYEVSSYCRPGYRSRHNQKYWKNVPLWGFGLSAVSYLQNTRFARSKYMDVYIDWVDRIKKNGFSPTEIGEITSESKEDMLEFVMLSLRTIDGFNLNDFETKFGHKCRNKAMKVLTRHMEDGLITMDPETSVAQLTDPKGFMLSNTVISDVFAAIQSRC